MGCGCGRKIARSKARKSKKSAIKKNGSVIRKRRISKLVSVPGTSIGKQHKKKISS